MMKRIIPNWCGWPNRENSRDFMDLFIFGARCDLWRSFFDSSVFKTLKSLNGTIMWFNRYEYFDKMICELDCHAIDAISAIEPLIKGRYDKPLEFIRKDIYDSRAWVKIPLHCFISTSSQIVEEFKFNERTDDYHWQYEILEKHEIPAIQFGVKKHWTVSEKDFSLTHRLLRFSEERKAVMTFSHPDLDFRFNGKRWVAEQIFPASFKRKEMTEILIDKVRTECEKHMVTIKD